MPIGPSNVPSAYLREREAAMTTSTNDLAYGLYVGVDIAETFAKVSWLMPGEAPSCAISMEQTPQAFSALEHRLLSRGHSAEHIMVADGSDRLLLDQPRDDSDAGWLCGERDQPGTSPSFCQGLTQAGQDRCYRCPNPGTIGLSASSDSVDAAATCLRRTAAALSTARQHPRTPKAGCAINCTHSARCPRSLPRCAPVWSS